MTLNLSCLESSCQYFQDDECAAGIHLVSQADTVNDQSIIPHLSRKDLTMLIEAYYLEMETLCGDNQALRLAAQYAENIRNMMPKEKDGYHY